MLGRSSLMGLAVMAALSAGPAMGQVRSLVPSPSYTKGQRDRMVGGRLFGQPTIGIKGASISAAQQKRNSKKARNIRRHKLACRG